YESYYVFLILVQISYRRKEVLFNIVYMKRFVNWYNQKFMEIPGRQITAYENHVYPSHASYTLDRYSQL
ncbi:hypothetical protein KA005_13230, partial [bacterium]|nr:hypothetical protein [bacterium]